MDEQEHDQLSDIHTEIQGSNAQLGRIDERTRNIENHIENLSDSVDKNSKDIDEVQAKVKRNTTILSGVTAGSMAVLLWISDKVTRLV